MKSVFRRHASRGSSFVLMLLAASACSDLGSAPEEEMDPGGADTVTVTATRDAVLYEDPSGGLASGAAARLFAGKTSSANGEVLRRSVLFFDLSGVQQTGELTSATLTLNCSKVPNDTPRDFTLHALEQSWTEGASEAPEPGGAGTLAATGDVTWIHRTFDTADWTTAGGTFNATASATTPVGAEGVYNWAGAGMENDVQTWLFDGRRNHGWILRGEEAISQTARRFDSRESTNPPTLTLTFRSAVPRR